MIGFQAILYPLGVLIVLMGGAMFLPLLIDLADGNRDWQVFAVSAALTIAAGLMLILANRGADLHRIGVRQAFVLTASSWLVTTAFGALPFVFGELRLSFTDAYFEAMSGLTTTGATVIVGLDDLPRGILLWRALLHALGGIGIVVMAVLILPFLRVGGQQLFRSESSDKSDKPFPRLAQVSAWIGAVYLTLNILCWIALAAAGMNWFDALCHAMSAVATGGFSTRDSSIAHFDSALIDWTLVLFMIAGSLPLTWYARVAREGWRPAWDSQVGTFVVVCILASFLLALWLVFTADMTLFQALRLSAFNAVSIISTTGFVTADFSAWGGFALVVFFLLYFVGGCSGGTTGSIKIFRWQVLWAALRAQMSRMHQPNRVTVILYNDRKVGDEVLLSVINFVFVFIASFAALSLAVAAVSGLDFVSAITAVAACLSNAGPGLGQVAGPVGNFRDLNDPTIWLLSFAMLFGRLELFTILVLLTPGFWRLWDAPPPRRARQD